MPQAGLELKVSWFLAHCLNHCTKLVLCIELKYILNQACKQPFVSFDCDKLQATRL